MQNNSFFSKFLNFIPVFLLFTIPIIFLDISNSFWTTPKTILITTSLVVGIFFWIHNLLVTGHTTNSKSPIHLPLFLFILSIIATLIFTREGRLDALVGKGGLLLALSGISYLLTLSRLKEKTLRLSIYALILSGFIVAIHGILQLTFLHSISTLPMYMQTRGFTLTGSPLASIGILIIGVIASTLLLRNSKSNSHKFFLIVNTIVQGTALVAYLALSLPGQELAPLLLPYSASWSLTLDAFKNIKSLALGIGINNFPYLFTQYKPLYLNTTPLWNVLPATSSSELLQLSITMGLVGLVTFSILPITTIMFGRHEATLELTTLKIIIITVLVLLIFTPATIPLLSILFISYGLLSSSQEHNIPMSSPSKWIVALLIGAFLCTIVYWGQKVVMAELHMKSAQIALTQGDGKAVYDSHIRAIELIPFLPAYHLSYSKVNMSFATSLSQKADLSDTDRTTIAQLVSQGVREARLVTDLIPSDSKAWSNLGGIYRNLVTSTEGADEFARASYAKAIELDAANPSLRVEYGGLLLELSDLAKDDKAKKAFLISSIQEFQTAVQLKNDYANAYYNLSKALEKDGNINGAYTAMDRAVTTLAQDSSDLESAKTELAALKQKLDSALPSPQVSPTN